MTTAPNRFGQWGLILLLTGLGSWIAGCALASHPGWGANPLVPWQSWPPFADLRILLVGVEAAQRGLDPLTSDSFYNYPPIWLKLGAFGWGPGDTIVLGLGLNLAFLLCIGCVFWCVAGSQSGWGWIGLVACPPLMLALERANNDLIIFMLVFAAGAWPRQKYGLAAATALVGLAGILKLYPLAALGALPPGGLNRNLRFASVLVVLGFSVYVAGNFAAIKGTVRKTPVSTRYSYGAGTTVERIGMRFPDFAARHAHLLRFSRYALSGGALLLIGVAFFIGREKSQTGRPEKTDDTRLGWYHGGAGIYVATYAVFINWEYRLIFLLLCVPWLHRLAQSPGHHFRARATLAGIAVVIWGVAFPFALSFVLTQAAGLLVALLLTYECGRQPPPLWSAWTKGPNASGLDS